VYKFLVSLLVLVPMSCVAASRARIDVYPPCHPIRGGVWSRLAYPMPMARFPQQAHLELEAPDNRHKFVAVGSDYPKVSILNKDKPLSIVLPSWVTSAQDSASPRRVQPTGAEFMWALDSRALAATENYKLASLNIAGGGWRVLVYLVHPLFVKPVFVDRQVAVAYKEAYKCKYLPDVGALKWTGSNRLLLLAQGAVNEQCRNRNWGTRGYLVAIPSGRILRTYTQKQLKRWKKIFGPGVGGRPYVQGHC